MRVGGERLRDRRNRVGDVADPDQGDPRRHPSLDDRFDPAIRIVSYDGGWPREFEREAAAIQSALDGVVLRVDHVGSTAVPGLDSKPIIDIQVAVEDVGDLDAFVPALERLGYLFAPDPDSPDLTSSESLLSVPADSTSTFARRAVRKKHGTSPCGTSSAHTKKKQRATATESGNLRPVHPAIVLRI
jgi:GrpB-like predicted nucleotidyltransferase (UPF0157 family)